MRPYILLTQWSSGIDASLNLNLTSSPDIVLDSFRFDDKRHIWCVFLYNFNRCHSLGKFSRRFVFLCLPENKLRHLLWTLSLIATIAATGIHAKITRYSLVFADNLRVCHCPRSTLWKIITKTRLFKDTKTFTTKNWKFSDKNSDIFSYFCSKHRLWVLVRTISARRF